MKKKLNTSHKLAIYMPHSLTHESGKMGLGILRFSTNKICCVIDPDHKGKNLKELTGIDKSIPIVSNLSRSHTIGGQRIDFRYCTLWRKASRYMDKTY